MQLIDSSHSVAVCVLCQNDDTPMTDAKPKPTASAAPSGSAAGSAAAAAPKPAAAGGGGASAEELADALKDPDFLNAIVNDLPGVDKSALQLDVCAPTPTSGQLRSIEPGQLTFVVVCCVDRKF